MLNIASGPLPRHLYCFADKSFTRTGGTGFEPCVWFGLTAVPGRMWGCHVLLECGAVYRALPPHALAFAADPPAWGPQDAQEWDCYGLQWSGLVYPYLDGLRVSARCGDANLSGEYLFTAVPIGDAYTHAPEQAKEFVFVKLDNGRLTVQPTNRVLFEELSFTTGAEWPTDVKRQTEVYSCEAFDE